MGQLGLGVMIRMLGGNVDTRDAITRAKGKKISKVELVNNELLLFLKNDGKCLKIFDDGQSCCESRYTVCDDDLPSFVGAVILDVLERDGPDMDDGDVHETMFVAVRTDKGDITLCTHNEHNGYYGGFSIQCRLSKVA